MTDTLMPYLVTATDARGRRDTFAREAASLEHLRNVLEREGYTDIEFIDDELSARLRQQRPDDGKPVTQADYRFEAKVQRGVRPADAWMMALRKNALLFVIAAAAAGYGLWSGSWGWTVGAAVVVAAWLWLFRRGRAQAQGYEDLLRAYARGEYEEAASLIEALQSDPSLADMEQMQHDLAFRAAALRARAGDIAGALADVEPLRGSEHSAGGMFENRVSSLHYLAGDLPAFIEGIEAGYTASGESQAMRLDLAFAHARVGDTARAREMLDGVERRNLSVLHKPIAVAVEGILARRGGDEDGGALLLSDAVAGLSAFAANPAAWPIFGILVGHQALALARSDDLEEARNALQGWEEVVDACLDAPTRAELHAALKS